jgi:predicted dehydrogenase
MVKACADRNIPLCCGAITTTHPSFAKAKELLRNGAIGEVLSVEANGPMAQHQNWAYFLDSPPAWVVGAGDQPRRETGSDEFVGQGVMLTKNGTIVHFRKGAPGVRLSGSKGEISFDYTAGGDAWRLWQDIETPAGKKRVEMPWPKPQFLFPYGAVYCLADIIDCLEGRLDEPKNSGRRVAVALEVEIALKQSSQGSGLRVDLPLSDRSLGLNYDWFR